jgi:nucleoside-diphosphate-sugar epimerase
MGKSLGRDTVTKRALITGSAGFIGRHFMRKLVEDGWDVIGVDPAAVNHKGDFTSVTMNAHRVFADRAWPTFDLVIHAAARSPHRRAIDTAPGMAATNAELDAALFRWAIETHQHRILYFSSSAVYSDDLTKTWCVPFLESSGFDGQPFDSYGMTKRHGEELAHVASACGVNTVIVRPFSGYGEDQSRDFPFGMFLARTMEKHDPFIIWGNADQQRDFIHIDDIVDGAMTLVENEVYGLPVNLATRTATSMRQLAQHFIGAFRSVVEPFAERPMIKVDPHAPMGVVYRVGDSSRLARWYVPQIDILEGVVRAVRKAAGK